MCVSKKESLDLCVSTRVCIHGYACLLRMPTTIEIERYLDANPMDCCTMLRAQSFAMVSLYKLRKSFRRDSTTRTHPVARKGDEELITVQRMEKLLRESNVNSKSFHVKVSVMYYHCFDSEILYCYGLRFTTSLFFCGYTCTIIVHG